MLENPLPDLVCLAHLAWDDVYQRPHHLMSRFATERRVFYIQEAEWGRGPVRLEVRHVQDRLWVAVPYLDFGMSSQEVHAVQGALFEDLFAQFDLQEYLFWYYTPMPVPSTRRFTPRVTVYDCMDELSHFRNAPPVLLEREAELLQRADLLFTGGASLYELKCDRHPNIYLFPSSIDVSHFARARHDMEDPPDQATIPSPRLGYFGVIDERIDLDLLDEVAQARPEWQIVMVGPVRKVDCERLPRHPNLHYLGKKAYDSLPAYLAGWDVALMPFAHNEATRYISPTKTPEYLAGGRPVVSTSIRDVVLQFGRNGLVHIADGVEAWVKAVEQALEQKHDPVWLARVDASLEATSWDRTWQGMRAVVDEVLRTRPVPER